MSEIPVECQPLVAELEDLRREWAAAVEAVAEARSVGEREQATEAARLAKYAMDAKQAELNRCRGCLDPAVVTFEDLFGLGGRIACSDPRLGGVDFPTLMSFHEGDGLGLSFRVIGCGHEQVVSRPGWSASWSAFPRFPTFPLARTFPDVFTGPPGPVGLTFAPYRVTLTTSGRLTAVGGAYDRATGHLDLTVDATINWTPIGAPPRWAWPLYGLDFGATSYRGLFTTRAVDKVIAPLGPVITGSPVSGQFRNLTLVAAGTFVGGFANGARFELSLAAHLAGDSL